MARAGASDRLIVLGPGCCAVPERLLLAHSQGRVLFITGAGSSAPANLPDFRTLVLNTYERVDAAAHSVLTTIPADGNLKGVNLSLLSAKQCAEINQFSKAYYDVVLGMLERRIDGGGSSDTTVRECMANILREAGKTPAPIHRALVRLADRGGARTIATTNFDLLLEASAKRQRQSIQSYALGAIPRPSRRRSFAGVLHIHGALDPDGNRIFDFVVSDQDFGEFYLRRRVVPDFIYDVARLFNIVLDLNSQCDLGLAQCDHRHRPRARRPGVVMARTWPIQGDQDRQLFSLAAAFLEGRLESRDTIEWALSPTLPSAVREALDSLIDQARRRGLEERRAEVGLSNGGAC